MGVFNLIRVTSQDEILNIKLNTKKVGQILKQFEKKLESCKVSCNDSVIYK